MKKVLIIGGGTAGIMTAAQLLKEGSFEVSIIEPSESHYYQPAWTLVGANTYDFEKTRKAMSEVIPAKANWIKDYAEEIQAEQNQVKCRSGKTYGYDYLVVAPGIKIDTTLIKGLTESIDKGVVCSNYTDPKHTWEVLKNFRGGTALFTQAATPIKCGGAPQKIMYLADDHFEKVGIKEKTDVVFATPGSVIFGVKPIAKTLMEVIERKQINVRYHHKLVEVDAEKQIAWYEVTKEPGDCVVIEDRKGDMVDESINYNYEGKNVKVSQESGRYGIHFDMLHLAPPQTAPDLVKNSPLANEAGWLNVDIATMQHKEYANVFGLGDAAALPTAKTGAAIRKQVPVVVENIIRLAKTDTITDMKYNGYSSCPLVTGYGKMVLAEFDYQSNFTPDPKLKRMLVFNSDKEHWRLWMLKKYMLPYLYWNKMMKGERV